MNRRQVEREDSSWNAMREASLHHFLDWVSCPQETCLSESFRCFDGGNEEETEPFHCFDANEGETESSAVGGDDDVEQGMETESFVVVVAIDD